MNTPREDCASVIRGLVYAMKCAENAQDTLECADAILHVRCKWGGILRQHDRDQQEQGSFSRPAATGTSERSDGDDTA